MNKFYTFFNYNWFKIIKDNIKNNKKEETKKEEKRILSKLITKKEICGIVFVILNFLITYHASVEAYKARYESNIFMHIFKDNIKTSIIWFIVLSILPIITNILITKKIKSKHYLIIEILYILSNVFNILMLTYFITEFVNSIVLGILGIMNIILMVLINSNIIIKIKENYLK